jgi:YidC/Oxa1 family membrane protein insertase
LPEIRNPNLQTQGSGGSGGGGGDMRSTLVFWLVLMLAFFGYEAFFNKPKPQPPAQNQGQQQSTQPAATPSGAATPSAVGQAKAAGTAAQSAASTPGITAASESSVTVENELYKIVLTNRGGQVQHWILKKYLSSDGKPLDLVQPQIAAKFGFPLGLFTYDSALMTQLNSALYQVTISGGQTSGTVLAPATVTFHYAENGLDAVKTLRFGSDYVVDVDTKVTNNGSPVQALVKWPAGLGDMEEFLPSSLTRSQVRTSVASYFVSSVNGNQNMTAAKKVSSNATFEGPHSYVGIMDLYFAAVFIPDSPDQATAVSLHNTVDLPKNLADPNSEKTPADVIGAAVGSTTGETRLRLFAGPKDRDVLSAIRTMGPDGKPDGPSLDPLVHFGWFSIIAKPLYLALRFLHGMLGQGRNSWGWAIVIVAIILNMVTLPSRLMMTKSSLKMMRIQPKVDVIKNRYKNLKATDPKRAEMNQEMMALYKEEGVNMYGSCLPMLIQMPLLYAIYEVLEVAIELRQAHWLWIPDLSGPDPTYILPGVFILTMFLVQYITPSPGMDPAQRRMMAFVMPVIFGFTLFHFPSGLSLYWFVGNLINLAIQVGINQSSIGKEMHAIAARRAAKKNPKIIQGRR